MKFMKLGSRLDTFFTADGIRSVCTEVSTDLMIQVEDTRYLLHKFPLLSKCARLQRLCAEATGDCRDQVVFLPDFPGGVEAFEVCAKFCYGIAVTVSALNIVPARCAAEYLQMTDELDRGNLAGKLEAFLNSCVLRRWRDSLVALQGTRALPRWSEELGITARCVDAVASVILTNPTYSTRSAVSSASSSRGGRGWWAEDIAELSIDLYWRVMISVKSSAGRASDKLVGKALKVYAYRRLPTLSRDHRSRLGLRETSASAAQEEEVAAASKHRQLLEKIVALLPAEKGSVSCSFLLKLLKSANILNAAAATKMELARRAGLQLEEATVRDLLLIPSASDRTETLYDVDIVMAMLEEFLLQVQSPPTSPHRGGGRLAGTYERRRSRSAENLDAMGQESCARRSSSSASHSSKLRVAKLIDGYLLEIAGDANLPLGKLVALAEAVPEFARTDHDDLYRVVDTYLKAHPELDKSERKRLCRVLDCKKLSVEACMHAAQNELLPLRVVVQVLFFDQARAATSGGGRVPELPGNIKAILARAAAAAAAAAAASQDDDDGGGSAKPLRMGTPAAPAIDAWSISSVKSQKQKVATLRMKLEEADDDGEEDGVFLPQEGEGGLERSTSSRFKSLCAIPNKPKRILSKFWTMSRSSSERH